MRIDTTDAMTMFETLGAAVKEAGIGKYNGFLLVEALRTKGWRLLIEPLPIEVEHPVTPQSAAMWIRDEPISPAAA